MLCGIWQAFPHCGKAWCLSTVCSQLLVTHHVLILGMKAHILTLQHGSVPRLPSVRNTWQAACACNQVCCYCWCCTVTPQPNLQDAWMQCLQDSTMPNTLASICDNVTFANPPASSSEFCQGFVYDAAKNIAFFKPQPASGLLDTSDLCSSPIAYTWLRTTRSATWLTYLSFLDEHSRIVFCNPNARHYAWRNQMVLACGCIMDQSCLRHE